MSVIDSLFIYNEGSGKWKYRHDQVDGIFKDGMNRLSLQLMKKYSSSTEKAT